MIDLPYEQVLELIDPCRRTSRVSAVNASGSPAAVASGSGSWAGWVVNTVSGMGSAAR
jgi:hypothetical protein